MKVDTDKDKYSLSSGTMQKIGFSSVNETNHYPVNDMTRLLIATVICVGNYFGKLRNRAVFSNDSLKDFSHFTDS